MTTQFAEIRWLSQVCKCDRFTTGFHQGLTGVILIGQALLLYGLTLAAFLGFVLFYEECRLPWAYGPGIGSIAGDHRLGFLVSPADSACYNYLLR
jgi:hypothetical protein